MFIYLRAKWYFLGLKKSGLKGVDGIFGVITRKRCLPLEKNEESCQYPSNVSTFKSRGPQSSEYFDLLSIIKLNLKGITHILTKRVLYIKHYLYYLHFNSCSLFPVKPTNHCPDIHMLVIS